MKYPDSHSVPDYTGLLRLDHRGFIVFGAGDGMGRQACHALAQCGASVLCVDRDADLARSVAREIDGIPFAADVTKRSEVEAAFSGAAAEFGNTLSGIVDVVGFAFTGPLADMSEEMWDQQFNIVLRHAYLILQLGAAALSGRAGASMVFVGSISGIVSVANQAAYGAAKAALHHLVRTAAHELGPRGIRVNAVAPGFVRTPRLLARLDEKFWDTVAAGNPLRRVAVPADVAGPILFLSTGLAAYVNGNVLTLDGGTNFVAALP